MVTRDKEPYVKIFLKMYCRNIVGQRNITRNNTFFKEVKKRMKILYNEQTKTKSLMNQLALICV